jgi:hypothetical protein
MSWYQPKEIGFAVRRQLDAMGFAARLFMRLCTTLAYALKRNQLVRDQIHFLGNYSLPIIARWPGCLSVLYLACRAITCSSAMVQQNRWA